MRVGGGQSFCHWKDGHTSNDLYRRGKGQLDIPSTSARKSERGRVGTRGRMSLLDLEEEARIVWD